MFEDLIFLFLIFTQLLFLKNQKKKVLQRVLHFNLLSYCFL